MISVFPGLGTVLNAGTVVIGALAGMTIGHRLPAATRDVVTDCLGLVTLLMAALSAMAVTDDAFSGAVGGSAPVLIVLGSLLIGGIAGSLLHVEARLEGLAGRIQAFLSARFAVAGAGSGDTAAAGDVAADSPAAQASSPTSDPAADASTADLAEPADPADPEGHTRGVPDASPRERFIEGWLTATLLFCVGPLTILGALDDGLGRGIDRLAVKSVLDAFAAMAFAASFGVGVLASAVSVLLIQGLITLAGLLLGAVMPAEQISALTATGGLLLVGIAFRLLRIRDIPVGDLLPALLVAPLLTAAVAAFH